MEPYSKGFFFFFLIKLINKKTWRSTLCAQTDSGHSEGSYYQCTDHFSLINNEELAYCILKDQQGVHAELPPTERFKE
jgi:hypothetical protein